MLQKAVPVLPAQNIRATIDFYEARLGFKGINLGNYAIVQCGFAELHFYLETNKATAPTASCYIYTDDAADLYSSFAAKDLSFASGQFTLGKREFSITDNNGNIITFGEAKKY